MEEEEERNLERMGSSSILLPSFLNSYAITLFLKYCKALKWQSNLFYVLRFRSPHIAPLEVRECLPRMMVAV
jgi:hypothetical protein